MQIFYLKTSIYLNLIITFALLNYEIVANDIIINKSNY